MAAKAKAGRRLRSCRGRKGPRNRWKRVGLGGEGGGGTPSVRRRSQGGKGEEKEEDTVTVIRGSQFSTFLLT